MIMVSSLERKSDHSVQARNSERQFGLVFAGAFVIVACWPLLRHESLRWWALAPALAFGFSAVLLPRILYWPNRLWLALGDLLHRVVSPIVMGAIFFGIVTPTAWIMRRRGKDLLWLKWDSSIETYWTERPPIPANGKSMNQQF